MCKINRLTSKNKHINHLKQNSNDFKFQLAIEIGSCVLSLYRKMSSLSAPDHMTIEYFVVLIAPSNFVVILLCSGQLCKFSENTN